MVYRDHRGCRPRLGCCVVGVCIVRDPSAQATHARFPTKTTSKAMTYAWFMPRWLLVVILVSLSGLTRVSSQVDGQRQESGATFYRGVGLMEGRVSFKGYDL